MEKFELSSEEIDKELQIDNSSVYALSECLKNHARLEAKYSRMAGMASKEVAKLELALEVLVALLVEKEITRLGSTSASARQEARKTVAKYPEYQELRGKLIEAQATSDTFRGLMSAWISRGFRLQEIAKLADRAMFDAPRVYMGDLQRKSDEAAENMKR